MWQRQGLTSFTQILGTISWFSVLKGTVSVISSDPPGKEGNAGFTTVPFKFSSQTTFFNELALKNWAMNMHFNFILILYKAFFYGEEGGMGHPPHTGLTRVSSIRFLLFEIKRVLVFNSIIIYFTDLFILYIFI